MACSRMYRITGTAALLAALVVPATGSMATASPTSPWISFHDVYTEVTRNTCDVPGLKVRLVSTNDGRLRWTPRGSDRLPHLMQHNTTSDVYTNMATGQSVTEVASQRENMLDVTDNGDGTLTFLEQAVYRAAMYNEAGKAIAHRTGRFRIELVFDHAGTPTNLDDDEFVSFRFIKPARHGDDFCTALVGAIG